MPVLLRNGERVLKTYGLLDDGAERTILLAAAAQHLKLQGKRESLALRTIRHDVAHLTGSSVDFQLSPTARPEERYPITGAFTANRLALAEQSYPVEALQKRYPHLKGIPLQPFERAQPLILIGADHTSLITAKEPIRLGPTGGPAAVHTQLGWALQGPDGLLQHQVPTQQCFLTTLSSPPDDLYKHVEQLWKPDVLPYRSDKLVTRSRQDNEAVEILESMTKCVNDGDILRYATPLLRMRDAPLLKATKDIMMPNLRSTERRLARSPDRAKVYNAEILKLVDAGYVTKITQDVAEQSEESWFIPHHLVHHNGKDRLVFNCSFSYQGLSLNDQLLPGPTLGSTLVGVLLRFRQYAVAISGDIRAMFHQIRLLPKDRPLLRFIWRNMKRDDQPTIYEWQVLPFGTTCSPCCATFALQKHVRASKGMRTCYTHLNRASMSTTACTACRLHNLPRFCWIRCVHYCPMVDSRSDSGLAINPLSLPIYRQKHEPRAQSCV